MIRGLRGAQAVNALLMLMLGPSRRDEIDLDAAERAMANLSVVGVDVHKVHELAGGPESFVAAAEICLANRKILAEHGRPDVIDAAVLLGRDDNYVDPPTLVRLVSGRLARRPPARDENRDRAMEQLEAEEAAAVERRREVCQARRMRRGEQKAVRKTKARKTAGRGW